MSILEKQTEDRLAVGIILTRRSGENSNLLNKLRIIVASVTLPPIACRSRLDIETALANSETFRACAIPDAQDRFAQALAM